MPGRAHRRPWFNTPDILERVNKNWEEYLKGKGPYQICEEQKNSKTPVSLSTIERDIARARELILRNTTNDIVQLKTDAVQARRLAQSLALEDIIPATQDAKGRASLLTVYSDNQEAIENLQGLRRKEAPQVFSPTFIQIGTSAPKRIQDLSDEELLLARGELIEGELVDRGNGD